MANATDSTSRLFQAVRETQDEQLRLADANEQARARARLLQAVDQVGAQPTIATVNVGSGARPGAAWRWGLGGLIAAACAFAVVFVLPEDLAGDLASKDPVGDEDKHEFKSAALEFRLDGGLLAANQSISADDRARSLSVSDSTSIKLAPHGRMYLEEIRANGATVVLEQGEVSLAVHHQDNTSWRVAAGPWTVHVTGTQFVVAWEPNDLKFRVAVLEGSVRVEGPEGEIAQLRAGDKLVRARGKATLEPPTLGSQDRSQDPEPAVDPEVAGANPALNPALNPSGTSKPAAPGWDHFFNASDYQTAWEVLADQAGGIHGAAEQAADARTMLDLADVARFTKHGTDTRKVLERLRVRFPHSGEASEAAFALGRLAADGGSVATAAGWFELYLDERPNGSFAGDALGRLLDCYETLGKTKKAESAAELYLARNPKGPHADKAEKILAQ